VPYEIEVKEVEARPTLVIRATASPVKIPTLFGEFFSELYEYVGPRAQPEGGPFGRYFEVREDSIDFEAGVVLSAPIEGRGRIEASELPAGSVAVTWHVGPYETLTEAYSAVETWMKECGRAPAGPMWEVYWSDPQKDVDPTTWRTEIFWPIR
jgi:effector-binding domain-containing protein